MFESSESEVMLKIATLILLSALSVMETARSPRQYQNQIQNQTQNES